MLGLNLKKVITSSLMVVSLMALTPLGVQVQSGDKIALDGGIQKGILMLQVGD
jgi:hypothetical protein